MRNKGPIVSYVLPGGGEGGGDFSEGVQFSKSLERGGVQFYSQYLWEGVHFSPTCVFQEWSDRRFHLFYIKYHAKNGLRMIFITCNVSSSESPVVAPFIVLAGKCHMRAIT